MKRLACQRGPEIRFTLDIILLKYSRILVFGMTVFLGAIQDVYIYNLKQMKKFNSALINVFVYFSTIKNIRPAKIDID